MVFSWSSVLEDPAAEALRLVVRLTLFHSCLYRLVSAACLVMLPRVSVCVCTCVRVCVRVHVCVYVCVCVRVPSSVCLSLSVSLPYSLVLCFWISRPLHLATPVLNSKFDTNTCPITLHTPYFHTLPRTTRNGVACDTPSEHASKPPPTECALAWHGGTPHAGAPVNVLLALGKRQRVQARLEDLAGGVPVEVGERATRDYRGGVSKVSDGRQHAVLPRHEQAFDRAVRHARVPAAVFKTRVFAQPQQLLPDLAHAGLGCTCGGGRPLGFSPCSFALRPQFVGKFRATATGASCTNAVTHPTPHSHGRQLYQRCAASRTSNNVLLLCIIIILFINTPTLQDGRGGRYLTRKFQGHAIVVDIPLLDQKNCRLDLSNSRLESCVATKCEKVAYV